MLLVPALSSLWCRVVPLFRGWARTGSATIGRRWSRINYGRPLQPAQQLKPLTRERGAYWALLVAKFDDCASSLHG